jgi:hypothetical protein
MLGRAQRVFPAGSRLLMRLHCTALPAAAAPSRIHSHKATRSHNRSWCRSPRYPGPHRANNKPLRAGQGATSTPRNQAGAASLPGSGSQHTAQAAATHPCLRGAPPGGGPGRSRRSRPCAPWRRERSPRLRRRRAAAAWKGCGWLRRTAAACVCTCVLVPGQKPLTLRTHTTLSTCGTGKAAQLHPHPPSLPPPSAGHTTKLAAAAHTTAITQCSRMARPPTAPLACHVHEAKALWATRVPVGDHAAAATHAQRDGGGVEECRLRELAL